MHKDMVKALFGIDPVTHRDVFEGYHIPSNRWNGFACPSFDRKNTERLAEWLNRSAEEAGGGPEFYTAEWDGDVLVVTLPQNLEEGGEPERYAPDEDGLYDVGSWGWCWDDLEFPEGIDLSTSEAMDAYLLEGAEETHLSVNVSNAVNHALRGNGVIDWKVIVQAQNAASKAAIETFRKIKKKA